MAFDGGSIFHYRPESDRFELGETTGFDAAVVERIRKLDIATGKTSLDEAIAKRQPLQIPDVTKRTSNPLRDAALEAGLSAALIVPLLSAEDPLGALVLQRRQPGDFSPAVVSLMRAFADQSAIALENARYSRKGRELEIASQHKSQFVANMSHELRTTLAAILGYAELMQEGFYEPLGQKSLDALTRPMASTPWASSTRFWSSPRSSPVSSPSTWRNTPSRVMAIRRSSCSDPRYIPNISVSTLS